MAKVRAFKIRELSFGSAYKYFVVTSILVLPILVLLFLLISDDGTISSMPELPSSFELYQLPYLLLALVFILIVVGLSAGVMSIMFRTFSQIARLGFLTISSEDSEKGDGYSAIKLGKLTFVTNYKIQLIVIIFWVIGLTIFEMFYVPYWELPVYDVIELILISIIAIFLSPLIYAFPIYIASRFTPIGRLSLYKS